MLYLRNGRAYSHGTKDLWVNRMLDSHCDFELWPHPWLWPCIFMVNFLNSCKLLILTQIWRFQPVTWVWIHRGWLQNDAQSLKWYRRGALVVFHLSNFKVTRDKKESQILTQIRPFRTVTRVWNYWWLQNDAQSLKQHRRGALLFFKIIRQISRSHTAKNSRFLPNLNVSGL